MVSLWLICHEKNWRDWESSHAEELKADEYENESSKIKGA